MRICTNFLHLKQRIQQQQKQNVDNCIMSVLSEDLKRLRNKGHVSHGPNNVGHAIFILTARQK